MSAVKESKVGAAKGAPADKGHSAALAIEDVEIDEHCAGSRWTAADIDLLARIVAIIAMGQSAHAARIIAELLPAEPAIDDKALRADAKSTLMIKGGNDAQRKVSRYHRDGFIFEAISWAAAQQATGGNALLRDPHIKSTTQGLDGLMIELDGIGSAISRATIFEDKCSEDPRAKFRDEIMPAFLTYHEKARTAELIAAAAALLEKAGLNGTEATTEAGRVLDKEYRSYRGSLAITLEDDSKARRKRLFKGYDQLDGIDPDQRIGAVLVTADDLRAWFDALAERAVAYIDELEGGGA